MKVDIKKTLKPILALALGASLILPAHAHRSWIVPSATVLSGDEPWVTFDGAISNTLFYPDHFPLRLDGVNALGPDGNAVDIQNGHAGKYRSTFDLNLTQPGTYKVFTASGGLSARWENEAGERQMWPGRGQSANDADFDTQVPKDAKNLQVSRAWRRLETFVTAGEPNEAALKPTGQGLELEPITHPNDLFAGEEAEFRFLIDGEPAAGVEVEVVPGATRYRSSQDDIQLKTDAEGKFSVIWPAAGMYWLEASYRDDQAQPPATSRTGAYVATFEVLPE